ncbi:MAG: ELM1/GtrOC1 family putative glycosyltransferase, partial [Pseudomonadota bacterium]
GTERQQFRAERVFLWSVEKHRDPSRMYEIYLLKGLKGYISTLWITGFTNYRFAIPYFCDYQGRAIYNDVDQVWLTDPAELFDRDIGDAGFVSINDRDTSVMLIDCPRMAGVWNRDSVMRNSRKGIEARARAAGLWGPLEGRYNARDKEYEAGVSACVHFTTLHTQPWRPFPDQFIYADNPTGDLWPALEREADEAEFFPVSSLRPSAAWPDFLLWLSSQADGTELAELLGPHQEAVHKRTQKMRVGQWFTQVPDADLPWVLNRLFRSTRELDIECTEPLWIRSGHMRRSRHFWVEQLRMASRHNPATRWRLIRSYGWNREVLTGGPQPAGPIVVLSGHSARVRAKSEALANALARRTGCEVKRSRIHAGPIRLALQLLFGRKIRLDEPIDNASLLVASGGLSARAARSLVRQHPQPPKRILIGRHTGSVPEHAGVAVSMVHHQLPDHPHRITTLMGFGHQDYFQPTVQTARWQGWLDAPARVALLLGHLRHDKWSDASLKALVEGAMKWADQRGAKLLIVTTQKTAALAEQIERLVAGQADVYTWQDHQPDNPYALVLERAQALLAAGADAALLGDALSSAPPVYLWPHRQQVSGARALWQRLSARIAERALKPGHNNRGSVRPQQGLTYQCARLVERGWVVPPTGLHEWQAAMVERGLAAWVDDHATPSKRFEPEVDYICEQIGQLLAIDLSREGNFRHTLPSKSL